MWRYGLNWKQTDPARIEMYLIQKGGYYTVGGRRYGMGLLHHYLELRKLLWPQRWFHKWVKITYEEILQNQITILLGSASCGKTSIGAEYVLLDYWCFPNNTAVLVSTTTREKLEDAVFGEIKMLWRAARETRPWLAGHLVESKQAVFTDAVSKGRDNDDDENLTSRDARKGIKGKSCYTGKQYVGLGVFAGVKQERVRFLADELQFMPATFLDCLPNMFSNPDVKVIGSGNPRHDPDDQLGIAAEPEDGWQSVGDIEKTAVWPLKKFKDGRCINFIGTDSPNFDVPEGEPVPFPRLISRRFAKQLEHDYGINSPQYETQVKGRMKLSLAKSRVITRQLCEQHHAHDPVIWRGGPLTRILSLDPAYGGGDRCPLMKLEFGLNVNGKNVIRIFPYKLIHIDLAKPMTPEDQIAERVKDDSDAEGIPAENIFYDSFGKGTIGFSFARKFGANCPVPVDSGGPTTERIVRQDLYIFDEKRRQRRMKTCKEHYSKFVTEMWFSVRYCIEAEQLHDLPHDVMLEGCSREYYTVAGDRIEVEPKDDMKERTGKSPDLFDVLAIGIEGARRLGFIIDRLGRDVVDSRDPLAWFKEMQEKQAKARERLALNYSA